MLIRKARKVDWWMQMTLDIHTYKGKSNTVTRLLWTRISLIPCYSEFRLIHSWSESSGIKRTNPGYNEFEGVIPYNSVPVYSSKHERLKGCVLYNVSRVHTHVSERRFFVPHPNCQYLNTRFQSRRRKCIGREEKRLHRFSLCFLLARLYITKDKQTAASRR